MRVVINQLTAFGRKTGIGHYTEQLFRCLREQAGADQVDGFPQGFTRLLCERVAAIGPRLRARANEATRGACRRPLPSAVSGNFIEALRQGSRAILARHLRKLRARRAYDLYHEPNFIPLPGDGLSVATVHDLSVLLHPEWHPADRVAYFERHFQEGAKTCAHFLAVSEFGRDELIRVLGVRPERVSRVYNGIRPGLAPLPREEVAGKLRRLGLPDRYLLYMGTIEPRKNLLVLLRAYVALPEGLRRQWPLLLAGGWGWNSAEVAGFLHDEGRHRGVV